MCSVSDGISQSTTTTVGHQRKRQTPQRHSSLSRINKAFLFHSQPYSCNHEFMFRLFTITSSKSKGSSIRPITLFRSVWHEGFLHQEEATLIENKIKNLTQQIADIDKNRTINAQSKDELVKQLLNLKKEYEKVTGEAFEG
jgi:hypothetical protein